MGLAWRGAIMAWQIEQPNQAGANLAGLSVVSVKRASDTLGHQGVDVVDNSKSVIYVDDRAGEFHQQELVAFARKHLGIAGSIVVRV